MMAQNLTEKDSSPGLTTIDTAFGIIMNRRISLDTCRVPLLEALGRVLAEDQIAPFDLPPHDHAAMDGYAFSFSGAQRGELHACGFLSAGCEHQGLVASGEAIRIMTGAPVPSLCDTVVPLENLIVEQSRITFTKPFAAGDNIRRRGEDIRQGELLLAAGTLLRPQEIALLAAMNSAELPVCGRARGAVLATGDELLEPGSPLEPGKIINSNSSALAAMLLDAGAEPLCKGIAKDTLEATTEKIEACLDADFVLVTGGASAGDHDFVKTALEKLGGKILFSGVSIKPGKPFGFAALKNKPVFIMPGNPVAAMIIFELFVRPMLFSAMGFQKNFRPRVRVRLVEGFTNKGRHPHFVGGRLVISDDGYHASITGSQSSGRIASLTQANALLCLAPETVCRAGDEVTALLLDGNLQMENTYCPTADW
jgi:molybdopterin molybdotransferase